MFRVTAFPECTNLTASIGAMVAHDETDLTRRCEIYRFGIFKGFAAAQGEDASGALSNTQKHMDEYLDVKRQMVLSESGFRVEVGKLPLLASEIREKRKHFADVKSYAEKVNKNFEAVRVKYDTEKAKGNKESGKVRIEFESVEAESKIADEELEKATAPFKQDEAVYKKTVMEILLGGLGELAKKRKEVLRSELAIGAQMSEAAEAIVSPGDPTIAPLQEEIVRVKALLE